MSNLIANDFTTISAVRDHSRLVGIRLIAPVPGKGVQDMVVMQSDDPSLVELLSRVLQTGGLETVEPELSAPQRRLLVDKGFLLPADRAPQDVLYSCWLDDPPMALVPSRHRKPAPPRDDVQVNPTFHFQRGGQRLTMRLIKQGLAPAPAIATIQDPCTGISIRYHVRGRQQSALARYCAGQASVDGGVDRELLRQAHILVSKDEETARTSQWDRGMTVAQEQFRHDGYAVVPDLLHPFQSAALRRYYRDVVAHGFALSGDHQVDQRWIIHNEVVARALHQQLTGLISRLAGVPVKPSYVYFASYRDGAVLRKHVDREQCEYSVSLLVDYVPEPAHECPWPLYLQLKPVTRTDVPIFLGLGDGLVYRGRKLPHYRDALPAGHTSTSLFLHYVREDFQGRLD